VLEVPKKKIEEKLTSLERQLATYGKD